MTTNNTTTEPQTPAEIGHRPGHFDAAAKLAGQAYLMQDKAVALARLQSASKALDLVYYEIDAARFYGDLREADSLLDSLRPIMREIDNLKGAYSKQRIAASDSLDACIDEVIQ